jgi:Fe-S oxidoreductase
VRSIALLGALLLSVPALASEGGGIERTVFRQFDSLLIAAFYLFATVTVGVFLYGAWRQLQKYRRGRGAPGRLTPFVPRLISAMRTIAAHTTIKKRDGYAGVAHFLVFWGFITLLIGTTIVFIDHDFIELFFGFKTLTGTTYLVFSFAMELGGLAFLGGLMMMIVRRGTFKLPKLDYARVDLPAGKYDRSSYKRGDVLFLWLFVLIGVSGFLIEAARIAKDGPSFEVWSFVGWSLAQVGRPLLELDVTFQTIWWGHVILVFLFIGYLPHSKAMHMITDVLSLATRDPKAAVALPAVVDAESPGIKTMVDFDWRQLLSFDACTKCGRCHDVCPARTTNAPLSPRDLILDLREEANRSFGRSELFGRSRVDDAGDGPISGGYISADTLWACTTCRACVEICPVGIEHVVDIVQMRRSLVIEGNMADSLQDALKSLDEKGNSFGESARKRTKWTKDLDFTVKDPLAEEVDLLWFVGDFASFNERCQDSSRTFAKVMNAAGVDFGVLAKGEKSAGNDVRRVGEEGLFEALAADNIELLGKSRFKRIVTTDPHTFNTLKNEYPSHGGDYEVVHYSELLLELLKGGKLALPNAAKGRKVTYHDPCYLGRYNGIFDEPRQVLDACGVEVVEMPRNRENSFCCGAGGGRIWMPDPESATERPSENRINEAVALGVDTFVVACPKDMTMYSDAVKTSGNEGKIVVRDLVEFVAEAMTTPDSMEAAHG